MANVTLTVTDCTRAGINITDNDTTVSAGNNYFFPNNERVVLIITNAAGSNTLTVITPGTVDGLAITDLTVVLTASKTYAVGPFPKAYYNDATNSVQFTVSAGADIMPLRIP